MKRVISFVLSFVLLLSLSISVSAVTITITDKDGKTIKLNDFTDTQGHWAHDVILKWADYELINGAGDGKFLPNSPITRADLCVILDRMLGLKDKSYNVFYDLNSNAYYAEAILKCNAAGFITGTSSTTVDPLGKATREQVATIICRMLSLDTSNYSSVRKFSDDSYISSWARPYVYTMRKYGYMNGTGNNMINPRSNITRAEFVQVMNNIAGSYIPKRDPSGQGTTFKSDFTSNVMTSRNIELINSTVVGDLFLTQATSYLTLTNTTIAGRLFVMGKNTINMSNSKISKIYLKEGKSDITGINALISEVYVAQSASESRLDDIPIKLVLESGARIQIGTTMYENLSTEEKTYYGLDIKADIAAEQGYVVGGPKISNFAMKQSIDNVISVSSATVSSNTAAVKEIGVVWKNQKENKNEIIPTYQNNDGIYKYNNKKIDKSLSFDVNTISGTRVYRMYVKDENGLFAYSKSFTFTKYDYTISLEIYDKKYPQSITADLILQGDNIPDISDIHVSYGKSEVYSDSLEEQTLVLFTDSHLEYQIDKTKYRRYTGTINSESFIDTTTREPVYIPPTYFGYRVNFRDGTIINRFPVLSNVIPEGVSPMGELRTGYATYLSNGGIRVENNLITTRYILPQEIGVLYKISNNSTVSAPTAEANDWIKSKSNVDIGVGESAYYSSIISPGTTEGYTHYVAYVKTSNGYWYGTVNTIPNNSNGDTDGFVLYSANAEVIGDTEAIIKIAYENRDKTITQGCQVDLGALGKYSLNSLNWFTEDYNVYIMLNNLPEGNSYSIPLRVYDVYGNVSNAIMININTNNKVDLHLSNKTESGNNLIYSIVSNTYPMSAFDIKIATLKNANKSVVLNGTEVIVDKSINLSTEKLIITFNYGKFLFSRTLNLY